MNSIQIKRVQCINEIVATLKKTKEADIEIDKKMFLATMQFDYGITRRTALDYFNVAKYQL